MTTHATDSATALAALTASRLCHDLVSPLGAIGNGVELMEMAAAFPGAGGAATGAGGASPELDLIKESVAAARARIRVFRVAFGHTAEDQRLSGAELTALLTDAAAETRLTLRADLTGDLPRGEARMILLAFMCLTTVMPWGGEVVVARGPSGWRLVASSQRMRPAPELWAWLDRATPPDTLPAPGDVHFALLSAQARTARRPLHAELDATGAEIAF